MLTILGRAYVTVRSPFPRGGHGEEKGKNHNPPHLAQPCRSGLSSLRLCFGVLVWTCAKSRGMSRARAARSKPKRRRAKVQRKQAKALSLVNELDPAVPARTVRISDKLFRVFWPGPTLVRSACNQRIVPARSKMSPIRDAWAAMKHESAPGMAVRGWYSLAKVPGS